MQRNPDKEKLFGTAMTILAEEERLERQIEESTDKEARKKLEKQLERVKEMRRSILRVYSAMILRGLIVGGWKSTLIASKLKEWRKIG